MTVVDSRVRIVTLLAQQRPEAVVGLPESEWVDFKSAGLAGPYDLRQDSKKYGVRAYAVRRAWTVSRTPRTVASSMACVALGTPNCKPPLLAQAPAAPGPDPVDAAFDPALNGFLAHCRCLIAS